MTEIEALHSKVQEHLGSLIQNAKIACDELTIEITPDQLLEVCLILRDHPDFRFDMLVDVCGVDYLQYGIGEWETEAATETGFERGVDKSAIRHPQLKGPRFAAVYHLLSLTHNHRIRLRAFLEDTRLAVPSVIDIWPSANWFEREAFDLFGIMFLNHPDLRRLLTDYGFHGHPFRKDFPLSGQVEVRYDAKLARVIYEPVNIDHRILEPKVIRNDTRYENGTKPNG